MKKKIIFAGLITILILIGGLTSIGSSNNLHSSDFINELESLLIDHEEITIDELLDAQSLISDKIHEKIIEPEEWYPRLFCKFLEGYISTARKLAEKYRGLAEQTDNETLKEVFLAIAEFYEDIADRWQPLYDKWCTGHSVVFESAESSTEETIVEDLYNIIGDLESSDSSSGCGCT